MFATLYLAYLCENSIEIGIAHASTQSSWAHRDDSVNFPDARIKLLKYQSSATITIAYPSAIRPSGAKGCVS